VTRFDYGPPPNDEAGKILVELKANAKGTLQTISCASWRLTSSAEQSAKSSPPRAFARDAGFDRGLRRGERRISIGAAAMARSSPARPGFHAEDPNATHRDTD
jgi:hypothetical protein